MTVLKICNSIGTFIIMRHILIENFSVRLQELISVAYIGHVSSVYPGTPVCTPQEIHDKTCDRHECDDHEPSYLKRRTCPLVYQSDYSEYAENFHRKVNIHSR